MNRFSLILLSGGQGKRLLSPTPKQYHFLGNKPLALYSFETFLRLNFFEDIVVVCNPIHEKFFLQKTQPIIFASPGSSRQQSVLSGFQCLKKPCEFVLIHDVARPFIREEAIKKLIEEGSSTGAATLGKKISFTVKEACENKLVKKTLDRDFLWDIQTPQLIKTSLLRQGFEEAIKKNLTVTDDVALVELLNHPVKIVTNNTMNLKITTPQDMDYALYLVTQKLNYV